MLKDSNMAVLKSSPVKKDCVIINNDLSREN